MPSKASATNGCDGVTAKNRPLGCPPHCHFAATEVSSGRRLRQRGGESTAEKEQAFAEGWAEAAGNRGPGQNACRRERQRALKGLTEPVRKDERMHRGWKKKGRQDSICVLGTHTGLGKGTGAGGFREHVYTPASVTNPSSQVPTRVLRPRVTCANRTRWRWAQSRGKLSSLIMEGRGASPCPRAQALWDRPWAGQGRGRDCVIGVSPAGGTGFWEVVG